MSSLPTTSFNADVEELLDMKQIVIVLVHVGKCAGESILSCLLRDGGSGFHVAEMHCYDADERIKATLLANCENFRYVIAVRDPIDRFISAFNWDKHNLYLQRTRKQARGPSRHYAKFPSVNDMLSGLQSNKKVDRRQAGELAAFAHMGMGLSWYLPEELIKSLPTERSYLIDTDRISEDLDQTLVQLFGRNLDPLQGVPRLKSDYKSEYADSEELFSTHVSPENRLFLAEWLAADSRSHQLLAALLVPR